MAMKLEEELEKFKGSFEKDEVADMWTHDMRG
jgi:hypothetical protein